MITRIDNRRWLRWHVIEARRRFMFFIYSPFVHISLVLNNNCCVCLRVYAVLCCYILTSVRHVYTRVRVFAVDAQFIAVYRLNKTFLRYALTYYHYYRYHYRKNKSLNNHIRVVESLSWRDQEELGEEAYGGGSRSGHVCMRTFMNVRVYKCKRVRMHVCVCVYMCVRKYTWTHARRRDGGEDADCGTGRTRGEG